MKKPLGIPKEVQEQLDIKHKEPKKPLEVTVVVEKHQAKVPIPIQIRTELILMKGQKCKVKYDKSKKELTYQF